MTHAADDLCAFIDAAPAPWQAADEIERRLAAAGFQALRLEDPAWSLAAGGRYRVRRGCAVIAFAVRHLPWKRVHAIGAHVDSPCLRLRPRPAYAAEGCRMLGVEVYGGCLHHSWFDRDLGLAGVAVGADGRERPVLLRRPLARVAELAIHLDRTVADQGFKPNTQLHLNPIWGLDHGPAADQDFAALVCEGAGLAPGSLAAHDLCLFDLAPATRGGARNELILAPRLDNLASCHAGLVALLAAAESGDGEALPLLACFDHEEVGSETDSGADGCLLDRVLERAAIAAGLDRPAQLAALASSTLLSADMAHAVHPNYADKHDPRHRPRLGGGPVLKTNANRRYATDAAGAALLRGLAAGAGVPLQDFAARNDLGCGSTIGPACAARLGMRVIDCGMPQLSMHAARELAAADDHAAYIRLLGAFLAQ